MKHGFSPPAVEPRAAARFSAAQRHDILLNQSDEGVAFCDACGEAVAVLSPDGHWMRQRPIEFDHVEARAFGGRTSIENGRALCGHPFECHKTKTAADLATLAKAERQAGRTGQFARRMARKGRGERPLIQGKGFQKW